MFSVALGEHCWCAAGARGWLLAWLGANGLARGGGAAIVGCSEDPRRTTQA